jgi:predicted O-linked N-acetylglucosamine transferase (SPINDLY family)
MNNFINLYNQLLQNPESNDQMKTYIINQGITIIKSSQNIIEKEDLLLKLILLCPKDSNLYYMLGELFKKTNPLKAITWYKICHQIDPNNKSNIIDMIITLFENGLTRRVFEIINPKDPIYTDLLEDPRFLGTYSRCNFQQLYYKNGVPCLLKLIKLSSTTQCKTNDEKVTKWANYHDLGYVYCAMGEIEKSLQYTNKAVELANKFNLNIWNKLLSFSNSLCYADFLYSDNDEIFKQYLKINDYLPDNPCFHYEARKRIIKNLYETTRTLPRKIKIGYLSSDYMYHAVANFIIPILKNHDKTQFEIVLYANQSEFDAEIFTSLNPQYHIIKNMSDKEAATLINKHGIDILFDLNGHTVNNRLGVFTYNPAPIQIAYLGFPNTTGLKSIQYRITDMIADPPTSKQRYTETLLKLPRCFLLYKSINQDAPIVPRTTPSNKTITQTNRIIIAAINKENKNSTFALDTWKKILKECPNTQILIKLETFDNNEERMEFYSQRLDVDPERIIIVNKLQNDEYNKLFTKIDILLDTFPYSGTTTTCNALFNSIPLVSLYNENYHAHNVSCSLLTNCGLSDLVAKTEEEYIRIVKDLVNNPCKIDEYKKTINKKFMKLMEPEPFMKDYEDVLMDVYKKYYCIDF